MIRVLFAAGSHRWAQFEDPLRAAFHDTRLEVDLSLDHDPDLTDYIIYAPNTDFADFSRFPKVKLVQSLWAGVENIVIDKTLTQPLARMVDIGLTEGMVEWVTGHMLRHHLGIDRHIVNPAREWVPEPPPLARGRTVAVLGLGELGAACATMLALLNFDVLGWSRGQKDIAGVSCRSGAAGLDEVLCQSDIVVLLLPLTPDTESVMNARTLALLPRGAVLINPGRGALIDDAALLAALDSGQVGHATLDVFREEPLPPTHPFWAHASVTVTPHIASETRAETASQVVVDNIRRVEAGERPRFLVDRGLGY